MKFTEDRLEQAIIELLSAEGYPHTLGEALDRNPDDVLIKSDLRQFLATRYKDDLITEYEIESIIHKLEYLPSSDLYDTNKAIMKLVEKYNDRDEQDLLRAEVIGDFSDEIIKLYHELREEMASFGEMGIDFEEKAFYDILLSLAHKYDFTYPEDKLLELSKEVKKLIDEKAKYTDWNKRDDIKAELQFDLMILLDEWGYPPVDSKEVYKEIFEQAENFKKNRVV